MQKQDIPALVAQMTLEEKASLCSGQDFWHTKAIERLGIPALMLSDGPHGLRKQEDNGDHLGINESIRAVCFPAACAVAAGFDTELAANMGDTLGKECAAEQVNVLLGPAVNMKRSPLCGRNFEYYSEDPYLAGKLAAAYVRGVQAHGVGTCIKHFAANNQEYRRMSNSSDLSERALHEIYLPAFETAVKEAQPTSIMCSYNKLNGTFASENKMLLTDILRDEWGFDGCVVTDWGAVNDRVKGLEAGLDLEMPGSGGVNDSEIVAAVKAGTLPEAVLDRTVTRLLEMYCKVEAAPAARDWDADHEKAVAYETECAVLLANNGILPLHIGKSVAYIGEFAAKPRYQGGGSSHINSWRVSSALEEAQQKGRAVRYAKGFAANADEYDEELAKQAIECAAAAEVAVIFAGLPDSFESEGYDRTHMRLPDCQNRLIHEICAVQPNTVVVLHNGSPVECPWAGEAAAILELYLGGEGVGEATGKLLWGEANPCGRLPETFPLHLEDNPSYLNFANDKEHTRYAEDIYIGYRYYDTKKQAVRWPFGYGLSYTNFAYSNLRLSKASFAEGETLKVMVDVTNTGARSGKEVVQLYIKDKTGTVSRPEKELKGFAKLALEAGETKTAEFELDARSLSFYSEELHDWYAASGEYSVCIARSAADIDCEAGFSFTTKRKLPFVITENTCVGDIMRNPAAAQAFAGMMGAFGGQSEQNSSAAANEAITPQMVASMMESMPLRSMRSFAHMSNEAMRQVIAALNAAVNGAQ